MTKNKYFWMAIFAVIFVMSQDYWFWDKPIKLHWLGLPTWVYYFMGLQFILGYAIYEFSKKYWK